jgi:hypothetical protein
VDKMANHSLSNFTDVKASLLTMSTQSSTLSTVKTLSGETKQEKMIKLLRTHMDKNGLNDWHISLSKAVKKLGSCNYTKKTISLSSFSIEVRTEAEILNTILHEIAHALCPGEGHGAKWVKKAIELGCDGKRCANSIKLTLAYNFECINGCRASYTRKCKSVDFLLAGKGTCKKHKIPMIAVVDNESSGSGKDDEVDDLLYS